MTKQSQNPHFARNKLRNYPKMSQRLQRFFSSLLDILFPPECASCGELLGRRSLFCPSCWSQVRLIHTPLCPLCGRSFSSKNDEDHPCGECLKKKRPFRKARSAALYEGPIMEAIHRVKYRGDMGLIRPLAAFLMEHISKNDGRRDWDLLVPVPLHSTRLRERGFNQSALLAREMSRALGTPENIFSLRKIKGTPPQVGLTMKERIKNVKGAFEVMNKDMFKEKNVLLIDDVYTTGATVSECARVLRKAGAASVDVLTLARTI